MPLTALTLVCPTSIHNGHVVVFSPSQTDMLSHLKIEHRKISVGEAKKCREMFAAGSTTLATPIVLWDRTTYNAGEMGHYTQRIRRALLEDMQPNPPHNLHTEVDYGIMTYMQ